MSRYFEAMQEAMSWLAEQSDTLFIGQAVAYPGTFMHGTLSDVPDGRRLEVPVTEQLQMQLTLGLSLGGFMPVSIFPRQNFMLLGLGDLVNMIDKLPAISDGQVSPRLIIRTAAGTTKPIHPGHQHVGNYAAAFREMLTTVDVIELDDVDEILPAYQRAYHSNKACLMIEFGDHYNDK